MRFILLIISLFICSFCFSQREANIWYFGANAGLDFNSGTPVPLLDGALSTTEGCATISDSSGNLLFYSDGTTVFNRDHEIMQNGTGLNGDDSSTHSAIVVPKPGDPFIYYIFTVPAVAGSDGLQYSEVDMRLDGGLGAINANKNVPLIGPVTEKLTAVKSSIANEFWVVSHLWESDEFVAFNVSNTGINTTPIVSATGTFVSSDDNFISEPIGQIKISPDGTKLAVARFVGISEFQLFDFDAATGIVSNPVTLLRGIDPNSGTSGLSGPYGVEFSPNSQVLYCGAFDEHLYQFDLSSGDPDDIVDSQLQLSTNIQLLGALQVATDGKIYVAYGQATAINVINNPNVVGTGCDYVVDAIDLGGPTSNFGLPPFIQTFFQPTIVFQNTCFGDATEFSINEPIDTAIWDFDDPASGANNTSTDLTPTHVFTAPGTYEVTAQVTSGSNTGSFTITVEIYDVPTVVQQPDDISVCVDSGQTDTFDFSPLTAQILGTQDPVVFEVVYSLDPDFINLIPDPTNYINTDPTETIYYRINNRQSIQCSDNGSFVITVSNRIEVPDSITDYELCDDDDDGDDTNGFVDSFLLSTKDSEALGNLDPNDYEVNYFTTLDDAVNFVNPIDKTVPYQNTTANAQTVFVRINDLTGSPCIDTSLQFDLVVNTLPTVTPIIELRQCDNDTDGFSLFNLNEAAVEISTNFINETFNFYPTLTDAENDTNVIPNPTTYQNQTVTTDRVWARTITEDGCYRVSEVVLIVSTTGIPATFQPTFTECDDFLDVNGDDNANNDNTDGITRFDFSSVTTDVEALFPPTQQLVITYYRNEADALAEENAIADPSNYRNIDSPNTQQIYIRVDSELDNDCLGLGPFITLNVDPVPTAAPVNDLILCDDLNDGDGFNGIVQSFNLDSQTSGILGALDPTNFTVTYHTSLADAEAGNNAIVNTSAYENITPSLQTIYIRVENNTTGCYSNQTTFDLIVNPLPIANPVPDLEVCDDNTDGSAQNGFAQTFDLQSQTTGILGGQDPDQFVVSYHASLANAEQGIAPLGTPFSNSVPFSQTIYVRVFDPNTQCANGITTFQAIVNPEPTTEEVSNLSYCDDDLDGDDTNGFVQNIDLESQTLGILGPTQPETDFTVTYHESQIDASTGSNALSSPYSNTIANQQTIYVRVVNNTTGCVNDDFTFEVIVNPLPAFSVTSPQIVCLNIPPLNIGIENPVAIYDYVWTDPNGNNLMGTNIDVSFGGTYTVTATTTDGTGCSRTREIVVNESDIAMFTENDVTIVDDSENNSITIDPNNLGIGDYEFALRDENGITTFYQDEPFFENLEGGVYTILIRDKNGCGTASLTVPVVEFPKFFTPNNDLIKDNWVIKGANSTFFPNSKIYIFNRYGKQVAELDIDGPGWDGTYNSRPLPSDDYWFSVMITDTNGNTRERKGNFSLLRR